MIKCNVSIYCYIYFVFYFYFNHQCLTTLTYVFAKLIYVCSTVTFRENYVILMLLLVNFLTICKAYTREPDIKYSEYQRTKIQS